MKTIKEAVEYLLECYNETKDELPKDKFNSLMGDLSAEIYSLKLSSPKSDKLNFGLVGIMLASTFDLDDPNRKYMMSAVVWGILEGKIDDLDEKNINELLNIELGNE